MMQCALPEGILRKTDLVSRIVDCRFSKRTHALRKSKNKEVLVSCPLRHIPCSAKQPRWVLYNTFLVSSGRCAPCSQFSGGHITKRGYRVLRINGKAIFEHRYVMEKKLGRKLSEKETVHHKNGKRADNRELNLELRMSGNHPMGWSLQQMREYLKTVPKQLGGLK